MWHQARKQERKLRCLMVDYKKRAERRRNYYELCKKDPCSFLRLQGSSMRIHIDPTVVAAAEGPRSMMAWNGDDENLIDRFDVRAHLDQIPEFKPGSSLPDALEVEDDMRCNYDRYRIIVQNDCARITEEAALKQIDLDERFGDVSKNSEQEDKKKSMVGKKAAIGFSYDESEDSSKKLSSAEKELSDEEQEDNDFEDVDLDIAFDIDEISDELKQQLDIVAITYGMSIGEFAEQLTKDKEDESELREAKIAEQEKAAMSGRKSRKERRLYKETMLRLRGVSPPRYQPPDQRARGSPTYSQRSRADSDSSRSPSPVVDSLEFITNLDDEAVTEQPRDLPSETNLPPHLRLSKNSSTTGWKQRRMRSVSPTDEPWKDSSNQISRKQLSPPPPVIKRYRRASLEKSSDDKSGLSSDEEGTSQGPSSYKSEGDHKGLSKSYTAAKSSLAAGKMSAKERLQRKMRSAINRTYREDKRTTEEKKDQMRREQQERADEIRHQAEELRKKDFTRHRHNSSSSRSRSRSRDRSMEKRSKEQYVSRRDDRQSGADYSGSGRGGYRYDPYRGSRDDHSGRYARDSREAYDSREMGDPRYRHRENRDNWSARENWTSRDNWDSRDSWDSNNHSRESHRGAGGHRSYSRSPTRRRNYR
ncbi:CLK4-associating serine/arginine rich protein-like [Watersipora subatra]|uniref:CLK4-associating serine/arginine rich protein-like n=1 Tax=Watersipora subatra TaxID=2589382 RepID=UPI00355B2BE9